MGGRYSVMSSLPLFSVIMPVYNKELYIRNTIASVLVQHCTSYEVIMIGGMSSDNTDEICHEFADKYPDRLQFIVQSGKGVSNARNNGIVTAKGKYVAFLDADDLWKPEYLAVMERLINDYPDAGMFCTGYSRKFQDGHIINKVMPVSRGLIDSFQSVMDCNGFVTMTSCVVCKREAVLDVGLFKEDYVIGEDLDFFIRMTLRYKAAYEPKILGTYLADIPTSLSNSCRGLVAPIPGDPELFEMKQTPQIVTYRNFWILMAVMWNLERGHRKEARFQVSRVTNGQNKKKVLYWILSYLPFSVFSSIHTAYNKYLWKGRDGENT